MLLFLFLVVIVREVFHPLLVFDSKISILYYFIEWTIVRSEWILYECADFL